MKKVSLLLFAVGCLAVSSGFVDEASAAKRPYRYIPLDAVPEGFDFFDPAAISDDRRVYGSVYACSEEEGCAPSVAVFHRGAITVLQEGLVIDANNHLKAAGGVVLDPATFQTQAALFKADETKLIPPLSNDEFTSIVLQLTDSNLALVLSLDPAFNATHYLTRRGEATPLDLGRDPVGQLALNDGGRISGTVQRRDGDRAFRYVPSSDQFTVLDPLPTEPSSWGQAINRNGDVLGYSFEFGALERIGVWRGKRFRTYFVEGTPEFPTLSNRLRWNERGLIVITDTNDLNSYLVPRPGVRLNLADLTRGPLPAWTLIVDINAHGDMVGVGGAERGDQSQVFLLRRVGRLPKHPPAADSVSASSAQPAVVPTQLGRQPELEAPLHEHLYPALGEPRFAKSGHLRRG